MSDFFKNKFLRSRSWDKEYLNDFKVWNGLLQSCKNTDSGQETRLRRETDDVFKTTIKTAQKLSCRLKIFQ